HYGPGPRGCGRRPGVGGRRGGRHRAAGKRRGDGRRMGRRARHGLVRDRLLDRPQGSPEVSGMNDTITAIPGVRVGHWTDRDAETGCTVVVFPEPNVATAEVRGAAPGTREYALLQPEMRVEQVQAILLTGGSAFGLAAADGVVRELEADGRGHDTLVGKVPIVPAAVLFDLFPAGHATVGAIVAVNAIGDVFTVEGEPLTGGAHEPGPPAMIPQAFTNNTTLVVVATDAAFDRIELRRLVFRAHDAIAACIRPAHTRWDGDIVFAVSCGEVEGDCDIAAEAAFAATAAAIESAVRNAVA